MIQTSMQCDVYKLGFVHNTCIFSLAESGKLPNIESYCLIIEIELEQLIPTLLIC